MAIFKKSIIIILCVTLAFSPLLYCGDFSYADNDDGWSYVQDPSQVSAAMKTYLKARNFFITVNPAPNFVSWSYETFKSQFAELGYDLDDMQQTLKYRYSTNGFVQFLYDDNWLVALNAWYGSLLEKYGITPNSEAKRIYSGAKITDDQGNSCYVYVQNSSSSVYFNTTNNIKYYGTPFRGLIGADAINLSNGVHIYTPSFNGNTSQFCIGVKNDNPSNKFVNLGSGSTVNTSSSGGVSFYINDNTYTYNYGTVCIYALQNSSNVLYAYAIGGYLEVINKNSNVKQYVTCRINTLNLTPQETNVDAQSKGDNNPFAGKDSAQVDTGKSSFDDINEDNDDDVPEVVVPVNPPAPPTDPYVPNPTGGNEDENGNFNWQMPDINVDWDLGDFSDIFPFSIPYDIIELFDIVDSEPVTPAIYQEVDFGAFNYTIDFDLSYFDEFMEYVRAMELFLYTLTLFIATRGIFKIY